MNLLFITAILGLILAVFLLTAHKLLDRIEFFLNQKIFLLDDDLKPIHTLMGSLIIIAGTFMLFVGGSYPSQLWFLYAVGTIAVMVGIAFIWFFPWLIKTSKEVEKHSLSTDSFVMKKRRLIGALLLISSLYIFYTILKI